MTGSISTDPYSFGRGEPRNDLADKLKPTPIEGVRAARLPNRNLLVTQGTSIPCVLETAMSSDVAGFVSCVVMRDVMSDSGNVVLMEKGTQVVGEYRGNVRRGSKRMFVLWTRAKTPTGVIAALASPATDALGRAGFDGDLDTHFWERFGSALLLSIVSDASSIGRQQLQDSSIQINNTTGATNTAAGIAVEQSINIPPTLNKNQGELVNIFVARDVDFSSVYQLRRIETRTQILDRTVPGGHRGPGCGDEMSAVVPSIERDGGRLVLARYLEPLAPYLADDTLTEIVVNRPGEIFVEGPGGWTRHEAPALTHAYLLHLATAAAGHTRQDIGPEHPVVSTSLIGEERCQIVVPPAVPAGMVSLTIRKPSVLTMTLDAFERAKLFDEVRAASDDLTADEHRLLALKEAGAWREFLELAVRTRRNIIISGATGSGKTTLSKALIAAIPAHERLITIEDTAELVVPHQNCVRLLYAKDGQGLAKIGPARTARILPADAARPYPVAGAARWHRLLLSTERELRPSRIDHDGSCRQCPARLRAADFIGQGKRGGTRSSSRRYPLAAAAAG